MRLFPILRNIFGTIPRAQVRRVANRYLKSALDCRQSQRATLDRLLRLNADSDFSREYGLDTARNSTEFRQRIPVSNFERFRPYVERLKKGESSALLGPRNKLLMFTLSSGTTSQSKYIPITTEFLADYRRGWNVWGIRMMDDYVKVGGQNIVQLSSDHDRYRTEGGIPCGNISGLVAAMQKKIVQTMYTVPASVARISDSDAKYYTILRLALADDTVGLVMTANPSTLIHLAKMAEVEAPRLIRDIADGTLTRDVSVGDDIRKAIRSRLGGKNPARARVLENLIRDTGRLLPKDYWPDLQLLAVWTGGSVATYLSALREFYGDYPIRDHGLSASEGRMTIPVDDEPGGVLDVGSHYFEFIPEEEYDSENATVLEAHELQEGRDYYILLTTPSGLYRYDICDVVRCVGFHGTTPRLIFLHKGAHIANLTGEKITETQVVSAVRTAVEQMHVRLRHYTLTPIWDDPPRYHLLAEEGDVLSARQGELLAARVDEILKTLNCEYQEKRDSGRLNPIAWLPLPSGTWAHHIGLRQQKLGGSLEQYKHPCLAPSLQFASQVLRESAAIVSSQVAQKKTA